MWPVLVGVGVLAGAIAAGIGALSLADALTATGLPNPGPATTYGLPFVRAAGEIAAVLAAGSFLFAAFLVPPQTNGVLDAGGYRALRLGTAASAVWTVCAALLVPLTVSDVSGQPLREHLNPVKRLVGGQPRRHRRRLALDRVHRCRRHAGQPSGAALGVDAGAAGRCADHARAAGPDRSFVGRAARTIWPPTACSSTSSRARCGRVGCWHCWLTRCVRGSTHDLAARRFSALALWCFVAMAASGVVNALVRIQLPDLVRSEYGWLVIGKFVALCVLGVIGWRQRRSGLAALSLDPEARGPLIRLALVEAAVFGATFGIAVGLGRTPPPPPLTEPSPVEVAIGYDFDGPPTVARVLVRLALRPDLRHGRDRHGGAVSARSAPAAPPR